MQYADYIQQIEIDALWNGRKHIKWQLNRDINILSGVNGVGKTTILNKVVHLLHTNEELTNHSGNVKIDFAPEGATCIRFDVVQKYTIDPDTILQQLQDKFVQYPDEKKTIFYDLVDTLYGTTDKTILRNEREIRLLQEGDVLTYHELSSGEKQMLLIMLTVLLQDGQPTVLFMDEPEVSLHMEWQKQLIDIITRLNPRVQLILTTHSPAIIMNGWIDKVTEVSEIVVQ